MRIKCFIQSVILQRKLPLTSSWSAPIIEFFGDNPLGLLTCPPLEDKISIIGSCAYQFLRITFKSWQLISTNFNFFTKFAMDNLQFYRNKIVHESQSISIEQFVLRVSHSYMDHCNAWEWKEQNKKSNGPLPSQGNFQLLFMWQ